VQFLFLRSAAAVCGCLVCAFHSATAVAAPSPSYAELLQRAPLTAPRVIANSAEVAAAEGRARQSAAWPNPTISIEKENFSGTGIYRGSSQSQTTFTLTQPLEIGGQRGARVQAGRADLDAARAQDEQARADFAYDLAIAYATAEAAQVRSTLLAEDLERAQQDVRQARALVEAGREGALRAVQAEAAAAGASAELEAARADATESLERLSSLTGSPEAFTSVGASLLTHAAGIERTYPEAPPLAPAVVAAQASRDAADQRVRVEKKRVLPALAVSLGARRFGADDTTAMVGGLSVSLPLFDRNRGAIAAASANRVAANARLEGMRLEVAAGWRSARVQVQAAAVRLTAAGLGEASAREAYRLARIGYEAGRASLLELLSTRRALTEAALRTLDASVARIRAEAAIARLSGQVPFGE